MTSSDEINLIAHQLFHRISLAKQNINALLNYYEDDKDYNIENKPNKNSFIDPNTVNYIHHYTNYIKMIKFEYKGIVFSVNIYAKNYENFSNYIYLIKLVIICCLHDKNGFNEKISLKIDLYLSELKKKLPEVPGAYVKKEHAKTGYSIFNDNIYICIYRREEWLKALIQELFFAFTIDLEGDKISYKNILSNNFCIDDDFLITNSLIEFCARFFNAAIFLYFEKGFKEIQPFQTEFKKMIVKEKQFSVSQSNKILKHFGLTYRDLTQNKGETHARNKFKDKGDLFCYFIVTSLLFIHHSRILQWINLEQNNFFNIKKKERELVIFVHYIAHCSKDSTTYKMFEKNEQKTEDSLGKTENKNIKCCYHRI
uniref:Uncharacterized protein n=1 Tax=viral metagenome TaxID=1070528 RepID=A0A6C0KZ56_9ZZZZ|tara:strand:+ start:18816 stop:19922 length:1107 start_codon:yes stop_codon:yes gene_type:complete